MRLSPVLLAAVAITAPLCGSLSANAQTANSLKQTAEVFTPATNQQPENNTGKDLASQSLESHSKLTEVKLPPDSESIVVGVFPAKSAAKATSEVIVPTLTTSTTAQIPQTTPDPAIQQPNSPPEISPPTTEQQTPSPTPETTPLEISPPTTEQQTPSPTPETTPPEISPPTTEQQTPAPTPETTPPQDNFNPPNATPETNEPRVLVSEVVVTPQTGQLSPELENQVYRVIRTQPGRTTTRSQLQEDINAIFGTGFFSNVQAVPEDTPLGVRVSFIVQPNPVLTKVEVQANPGTDVASVLPAGTT